MGTAVVQYYLNELLALFSFLFSIVVLTYCLGPQDEHRRVNNYLDTIEDENRSDKESIQAELPEILQAGGIAGNTNTMDEQTLINRLIDSVLIITHDRILAILFWFVVLGPMGAVLYRLTLALLQHEQRTENDDNEFTDDFSTAVKRLYYLLSWIPGHLTALSYAVMGSFVHALHAWQNKPVQQTTEYTEQPVEETTDTVSDTTGGTTTDTTTPANHRLLLRIGKAALQFDTRPPQDNNAVRETLGLCGRSLVAWITVLAIMTLAGWAS
jgi:membrane protein required for beta-lactamase induction